jgi:hypothetical protein
MHQPAGVIGGASDAGQWTGGLAAQPLPDHGEAERAFQLAERLGSVIAAAAELGTTWPSLRKAFSGTSWACWRATRRPSERAIEAACPRSGEPALPGLDPVFVALTTAHSPPGSAPTRSWPSGCGVPRSMQPWAPGWWWRRSCTARATPPSPPPLGPCRSPASPSDRGAAHKDRPSACLAAGSEKLVCTSSQRSSRCSRTAVSRSSA